MATRIRMRTHDFCYCMYLWMFVLWGVCHTYDRNLLVCSVLSTLLNSLCGCNDGLNKKQVEPIERSVRLEWNSRQTWSCIRVSVCRDDTGKKGGHCVQNLCGIWRYTDEWCAQYFIRYCYFSGTIYHLLFLFSFAILLLVQWFSLFVYLIVWLIDLMQRVNCIWWLYLVPCLNCNKQLCYLRD